MEFSNLGKHCHYCKQQDFLPIQCDKCNKYFCSTHANDHECIAIQTNSDQIIKKKVKTNKKEIRCKHCREKFKNYLIVKCKDCGYKFCVKHCRKTGHDCNLYRQIREFKRYEKIQKQKSCLVN